MQKTKVAYQGVKGAYAYIASNQYFGKGNTSLIECNTFQSAFDKVIDGVADYGMIPIENSTAGRVADVHLLLKRKPLHIVAELFLPIQHSLIVHPSATMQDIKTVYSHPQALMQCEDNLYQNGLKRVATADTAGAVQIVAKENDISMAAIASKEAAEIYGLKILNPSFQDFPHNATRFVVIAKEAKTPKFDNDCKYITTLIFDVKNESSALFQCLKAFSKNNINLLKLESYTDSNHFNIAHFYIDIEGHIESEPVHESLKVMKNNTNKVHVIGCYLMDEYRQNVR